VTSEIKITPIPIDHAISSLKESVQSFQASFPSEIKGDNQLGFLEEVNEINRTYSLILNEYQALLTQHLTETETSIEKIKETDQSLANFSIFKEG
jgi:hypothetical protein